MNSDRHLVQLFIEQRIHCASSEQLPALTLQFESYKIGHVDLPLIGAALSDDAQSYFMKGVTTTLQALAGLDQGHESWALIKLYYAVYFFLRESLALDNVAIIRCKNIYTINAKVGEMPVKRTGSKFRGDHVATISLHKDHFFGRDILNSQSIGESSPYDWLRERREWINYKRRYFIDGTGMLEFSAVERPFPDQIRQYSTDAIPIFCFDPDHAALALPIKRLQLSVARRSNASQLLAEMLGSMSAMISRSPSCRALLEFI